MRASGSLTFCVGLVIVNLHVLAAFPAQCNVFDLLSQVQQEVTITTQHFKQIHKHITPKPLKFDQMWINSSSPIPKQKSTCICGLRFMSESLKMILDHNEKLMVDTEELKEVIARLKNYLIPCVKETLQSRCEDPPPEPNFPSRDYDAKRWTLAILHSSQTFLSQVEELLKKAKWARMRNHKRFLK